MDWSASETIQVMTAFGTLLTAIFGGIMAVINIMQNHKLNMLKLQLQANTDTTEAQGAEVTDKLRQIRRDVNVVKETVTAPEEEKEGKT